MKRKKPYKTTGATYESTIAKALGKPAKEKFTLKNLDAMMKVVRKKCKPLEDGSYYIAIPPGMTKAQVAYLVKKHKCKIGPIPMKESRTLQYAPKKLILKCPCGNTKFDVVVERRDDVLPTLASTIHMCAYTICRKCKSGFIRTALQTEPADNPFKLGALYLTGPTFKADDIAEFLNAAP